MKTIALEVDTLLSGLTQEKATGNFRYLDRPLRFPVRETVLQQQWLITEYKPTVTYSMVWRDVPTVKEEDLAEEDK